MGYKRESHILGLVAQDDEITQGFIDGKDTHKETASIMFDIPYDDVDKVQRQSAKAITFGLIYGKGASSLSVDLGISTEEGERLVDKYYESKPRVREFIETTHAKAKRDGYVETLQGNRRNLNEIWNKRTEADALRKTVNTTIQGTGAYFTNLSVILIQDYIDLRNLKSKLIMTVHDSIVLDTPQEEYEEVAKVTKYIMENLPIEWTKYNLNGKEIAYPIEADVEIGWNYKDAVGFGLESIKTFKSLKGYIKFEKDKAKFADYEADNRISKEQMKAGIQAVENSIEAYRVME